MLRIMDWHLITSLLLLLVYIGTTSVHSFYTNEFVAHIEGGAEIANLLAAKYGFINGGEIENFPDHYQLHHHSVHRRSTRPSYGDHTAIQHEAAVNWIEQQVIRKRVRRDAVSMINDPKYRLQWYMNRKDGPNMNVESAWRMGYTGEGVVVSILDDGIDYTHPDLAKNYDPQASHDINDNDNNPMPRSNYDQTNRHGTRCAGEVAMEAGNGICGVGVAYNASIGGIRMLDGDVTDRIEGSSLGTHRDHIDIYSASWGPEDNGMTVDGPGRLAKQAFKDGIKKGRSGKGSIFVWASGNGGRSRDNCGCDGYTNSIYTISVSSISENGKAPWYLEECASTLATTYSSGSPKEKKVTTTDLEGRCTDDHTGTSASAPLAAGLCALALQANPNMTWRDLQYVIAMTSRNVSEDDETWATNGAGYSVSHRYGFGLMDAGAMVQLAGRWINLPTQQKCVLSLDANSRDISGSGELATFTLSTTSCENGPSYLEHVQSDIDATFGNRGALVLTLISPSGTRSRILGRRPRDKARGSFSSWPFMSTHFWGERSQGVWTLQVNNSLPKINSGHFRSWVLTLYGTEFLPSTARPLKQPRTNPDTPAPVKEVKGDVNHKVTLPRNSEYLGLCHKECFGGCDGPNSDQCYKCIHYRDRNTGECVEDCPDGYYNLPTMHTRCRACTVDCLTCSGPSYQECLSCIDGRFLMEKTAECVAVCDHKFFADVNTNTCKECSPLCNTCVNATTCIACEPHAVLSIAGLCTSTCSVNEYLDGSTCRRCSGSCLTCSGDGVDDCLSCIPGEVLKERRCVAEWTCTNGYYVRDRLSASKECIKCHVTCRNCDGPSSRECTECNQGYILQDGSCVLNCIDGYYKDAEGNCLACSVGCDQCTDDTNCIMCAPEFALLDGSCIQGCGAGYYEQEGHCMECYDLCSTCNGGGPQDCTECKPDSRYLLDGLCVLICPDGTYNDDSTFRCQECDETCKTCIGPDVNNCLTCETGLTLKGNLCMEDESLHCNLPCEECVDGSSDRCRSCSAPKFLLDEECVDSCTEGYVEDPENHECLHCNPSCKTCNGPSSQDCVSCKPEQYLYDQSTCDSHCPYTTYAEGNDWTCKPCHYTCLSCSGEGADQCETCEGNLFWENNRCVDECRDGKYGDWEEHQCMACYPTCATCDGPFSTQCLTCLDPLQLDHGSCVSGTNPDCSPRTYNSKMGGCDDCHSTCLTCTGPGPGDCTRCDYDRFLRKQAADDQRCEEECLPGYYPDYEVNVCRLCHQSCKTCVLGGEQDCMECRDGMYILSKEDGVFCVDRCPEGFYEVDEDSTADMSMTCQQCSPQCADCTEFYSHCISCRDNTFLFREQCMPSCLEGFVEDHESNRCLAEDRECPLNCKDCDEWGECQVCEDGFERYYGQCMRSPCAADQYLTLNGEGERVCERCHTTCAKCLGPRDDECLECTATYQLNNGQCTRQCDSNQFSQDGVCLACHPSCETCDQSSPFDCLTCPEGTVKTASGSSTTGECSIGCPKGTFKEGTQCLACDSNCLTCDGGDFNNCLSCKRQFYLTGNQRCIQTCPNGTYHYRNEDPMSDEFECRPCHSTCNNCYGPLQTECTSCHDDMYRLQHTCVTHCGTGFYPGTKSICQQCHSDCQSCWGSEHTKCISCTGDKKLVSHSQCLDECPSDSYLTVDFGAVCEKCHSKCKTCYDMGPFNCLSCNDGYRLDSNTCYSNACDLGSYFVDDETEGHTCKPCHSSCKECYGPSDTNCVACSSGLSLEKVDDDQFKCSSCCAEGQKPDLDNCCTCNKDTGSCLSSPNDVNKKSVVKSSLNQGAIIFVCILVVALFGLFFGILQARSRKKLCWKSSYDPFPTSFDNKEKELKITLRQNILPSSDEDDYFDDDDSDN